MDPSDLPALLAALPRALDSLARLQRQVGALHLLTSPTDPDISDRLTEAYARLEQAQMLLTALRDDLAVWTSKENAS